LRKSCRLGQHGARPSDLLVRAQAHQLVGVRLLPHRHPINPVLAGQPHAQPHAAVLCGDRCHRAARAVRPRRHEDGRRQGEEVQGKEEQLDWGFSVGIH